MKFHLVPLIIQVLDQNIPLGLKRETFDLQRDLHPAKLIDAYAIQVFQLMKLTSFSKKTIINYSFEIKFRGNSIQTIMNRNRLSFYQPKKKNRNIFFYYKKLLPNQQNRERNLRKPKIADAAQLRYNCRPRAV